MKKNKQFMPCKVAKKLLATSNLFVERELTQTGSSYDEYRWLRRGRTIARAFVHPEGRAHVRMLSTKKYVDTVFLGIRAKQLTERYREAEVDYTLPDDLLDYLDFT